MRILFVVQDISKPNGTERAVLNLANYLSNKLNYFVEIITCNFENDEVFFQVDKNIEIKHMNANEFPQSYIKKIIWHIEVAKRLNSYLKLNKIDKIISTNIYFNIILSLTKFRNKTIGCEHSPYLHPNLIFRTIRRLLYRRLECLVVLGKQDYSIYKKFMKNVKVIPNSLSFYPKQKSSLKNKMILSIGRFSYEKGFDMLIDTLNLVFQKHKEWKCVIIGQGEEESFLREKIKKYKIEENIIIKKPIKNIQNEYLNSSIYVLPSRYEAFGMVLVEAMACGVPCISFDCPIGPGNIIENNIDGILVSIGQIQMMADKICELIENEEERSKMGENARKNVRRYEIRNIINEWDEILKK